MMDHLAWKLEKLCDPSFNRFWLIHPCDRHDSQTDGW